ncbi:MAG: ATP-dependent DNA helicase RecG [Alphaproteobacteria bacterium]|nr:ATP-dependent DNA helicase RecG [Alphaproteobacteria bacterium]
MNKELVDFLNCDLQFIKGVGPILAARLADLLGGRRVLDFLLHKPHYVKPRGILESVLDAKPGEVLTIPVQIISHKKGGVFRGGKRAPTQVTCRDKLGADLVLQFFGTSFLEYWLEKLPIAEWRIVSGKMEFSGRNTNLTRGGAIINHPDFIEKLEDRHKIPEYQAIYPISDGLTQRIMANARDAIFAKLESINGQKPEIRKFFDAIHAIHYPTSNDDLAANSESISHAAYAELFAHQVAIALTRQKRKRGIVGRTLRGDGMLREKLYKMLPFKLTEAQNKAIEDIENDMARTEPMMRLVQGDVGSGKTVVALAAALNAAECKIQTALMAPTDTLAGQHYAKIKPICDTLGIVCDILTGRDKGALQKEKLVSIRSGRTKIIIGTHALFQDAVEYKDLGLVIIDEQHRFGVNQRATLVAKGCNPDFLALSATPIPRTLSMTIYGDMDISIIAQKPTGRIPIKTSRLSAERIATLTERLRIQILSGAKVFWVCPLVTESEDCDFAAAETRFEYLKARMPDGAIGLVHGQMDKKSRDKAMAEFADPSGKIKLLVATSVIEVGIDIPAATIMIIENAEKFGLSALHQLRGRVGRGSGQSFCILMHGNNLSEDGEKRLDVLVDTDDGFVIAEQDLMMRGAGELLGARQSGWVPYYFVDYREHRDLFKLATHNALELSESDPHLESDSGSMARDLMYIFDREVKLDG